MSRFELDTRTRILSETLRLMEKQRGQGVRIQDVAQAAGVSRQAVYLHFGSRTQLLIAAARYKDEVLEINKRLRPFIEAVGGVESLDEYVIFWGNYIPEIYGLAKALMAVQATDKAASAAWQDRMNAVRQGCFDVIHLLEREENLTAMWKAEDAVDMMWAMLSVSNWEALTITCGWSTSQYIRSLQIALKQIFVRQV